jgi:hypothetical protein|tara:strand:+ start:713 stop:1435 length:723 start_codon:yes stop_codon:yes gene_type:complete
MAEINFYANNVTATSSSGDAGYIQINHTAGSGLGFYGGGYGISVPVSTFQDTTFTTNSDGTATDYIQLHNTKYDAGNSGVLADGNSIANLNNVPNYLAPLNIRFTHSSAVKVQNCKLRIFDRNDIAKHASGVSTMVYEIRHPSALQSVTNLNFRGRTDNTWVEFDAEDSDNPADMTFTSSPGMSGLNTDSTDTDTAKGYSTTTGSAHTSARHDWYAALSASPHSIGSKTQYGLYFTVEYL